jgi:hypothetical protein
VYGLDPAKAFEAVKAKAPKTMASFGRDSYRGIPALEDLCTQYGDPTNRKIYVMSRDIEGRWMDMHQRATNIKTPID